MKSFRSKLLRSLLRNTPKLHEKSLQSGSMQRLSLALSYKSQWQGLPHACNRTGCNHRDVPAPSETFCAFSIALASVGVPIANTQSQPMSVGSILKLLGMRWKSQSSEHRVNFGALRAGRFLFLSSFPAGTAP